MKRILLMGNLNNTLQNIADCLSEDFHVQLSPENPEVAENLIKINKPHLVIYSQIAYEQDVEVMNMLERATINRDIPVLVIASSETLKTLEPYLETMEKLEYITRPVTKYGLINVCREILGVRVDSDKHENRDVEEKSGGKAPLIMVVDDSQFTLRRLDKLLKERYRVYTVKSGEQALKMLREVKPDLILLDYNMPGWDGKETYDRIKKDYIGRDIPVLFLTGVTERKKIYEALKLTPEDYILKPPVPEKLFERIDAALNER